MKIYTYTSLRDLRRTSFYSELCSLPQITASGDLAIVLRQQYRDFPSVLSMAEIEETLFPAWQGSAEAFAEYVLLGNILRDLEPDYPADLFHGAKQNQKDILNTIRFLIEADASPEDFVPRNSEQQLFREAWACFEDALGSTCNFQQELHVMEAYPAIFLDLACKRFDFLRADTIVLHGFFYVTPLQMRLIDLLRASGKDLIFLCCMDPSLENVQLTWRRTLESVFGGEELTLQAGETVHSKNFAFGALLDGASSPDAEAYSHVTLLRYASELDFIKDVERIRREGLQLFSADISTARDLLKMFYPEAFRKRHLLSYPVGQFVYRLYSCWNDPAHRVEIRYEDVHICFASGWLEAEGKNGKDLLCALEDLRPYLDRCRSPEEWRDALELLACAKDTVQQSFEGYLASVPPEHRSDHRLMGQPFDYLSCFSVDASSIEAVSSLIRRLISVIEELFRFTDSVDVGRHLKQLRRLLSEGPSESSVLSEEASIVRELLDRLDGSGLQSVSCPAGELADAVMLAVGSGILDEDTLSLEGGSNEPLVQYITYLESVPLGSGKGVHLCLADEDCLPGGEGRPGWPLSCRDIARMEARADGRRKLYLQLMRQVYEDAPLIKKYLFYSMLQNDRVEISWIAEKNGKAVGPSPYVQILRDSFHPREASPQGEAELPVPKDRGPIRSDPTPLLRSGPLLCKEKVYDLALCPFRYLYSYLLSEHPSFRSDFHYSFALSRLTGLLSETSGYTRARIGQELFRLLPYYRRVEEKQIEDFASAYAEGDDELDGILYPYARLNLHYLNRDVFVIAMEAAEFSSFDASAPQPLVPPEGDGMQLVCRYCPYEDTCPHALRKGDET